MKSDFVGLAERLEGMQTFDADLGIEAMNRLLPPHLGLTSNPLRSIDACLDMALHLFGAVKVDISFTLGVRGCDVTVTPPAGLAVSVTAPGPCSALLAAMCRVSDTF